MIPAWQMDGYERLRIEIVRSAVDDLKRALRKSDKEGAVCHEQRAMERWFLSGWGQTLCGGEGEYIIEKCKQTYKAPHGKLRAAPMAPEVEEKAYRDYKAGMSKKKIMQKHHITTFQYFQMLRRHGK